MADIFARRHKFLGGSKSAKDLTAATDDEDEAEMEQQSALSWLCGGGATGTKRQLTKQMSMRELTREAKWEKRKNQILQRRKSMMSETSTEATEGSPWTSTGGGSARILTDEDLDELRGSIELGFGFEEEKGGESLRETLPALDLYFAIRRQLSDPKLAGGRSSSSSSGSPCTATSSCSSNLCGGTPSPRSPRRPAPSPPEPWVLMSPGDNPQHVMTRLRHWAQAVACSARQCRKPGTE